MNPNHSFSDLGPSRDPLDVAAEQAAWRLATHQSLEAVDWEALQAKASYELREVDHAAHF
jgi:hypothetical protein